MYISEQSGRLLKVNGTGYASAKPDLVELRIEIVNLTMDYKETMDQAVHEIELLRNALESTGFERKDLKTTGFKIGPKYDSCYENGKSKQVLVGYECTHNLTLKFDLDSKRLGETLMTISTSRSSPKAWVNFFMKDKTIFATELLESAITNAKENAAIMAKAAGVGLGSIRYIEFDENDFRTSSSSSFSAAGPPDVKLCLSAEPNDVAASVSVEVVWNIE